MKWTISILLLAGAVWLHAADSAAPSANRAAETRITSESVNFDLKSRQAVYRGGVRVEDPRIGMTCERLTATISEAGGRVDSLVAESNVVAVVATNDTVFTVKAAKAIYTYLVSNTATNQTLELSGTPEPTITWPQEGSEPPRTNEFAARRILWDIGTGNITAEGHRGVFPSVDALNKPVKQTAPATTNKAPVVTPASNP